ncbi:unnamed protein product [Sympodiomycopsis kandeliae]
MDSRLVISNTAQLISNLDSLLNNRQSLRDIKEVTCSSFEDDTECTGAYVLTTDRAVDPRTPHIKVATGSSTPALWPWRKLTELLCEVAPFDAPLECLNLHCTAQRLISYDGPDEWAKDAATKAGFEETERLLKSRAQKTFVKRLVLSGQCWTESYWPHLNVTDEIEIRGCQHGISEAFLDRLTLIPTEPETLILTCLGPFDDHYVSALIAEVGYVQRIRYFVGMKRHLDAGGSLQDYATKNATKKGQRYFKRVVIRIQRDENFCRRVRNFWTRQVPSPYKCDTDLIVESCPFTVDSHLRGPSRTVTIPTYEKELFVQGQVSSASSGSTSSSSTLSDSSLPGLSDFSTHHGASSASYGPSSPEPDHFTNTFAGSGKHKVKGHIANLDFDKNVPHGSSEWTESRQYVDEQRLRLDNKFNQGIAQSKQVDDRVDQPMQKTNSVRVEDGIPILSAHTGIEETFKNVPDSQDIVMPCNSHSQDTVRKPRGPIRLGDCGCTGQHNELNAAGYRFLERPSSWLVQNIPETELKNPDHDPYAEDYDDDDHFLDEDQDLDMYEHDLEDALYDEIRHLSALIIHQASPKIVRPWFLLDPTL